jgi:hypothetical protein
MASRIRREAIRVLTIGIGLPLIIIFCNSLNKSRPTTINDVEGDTAAAGTEFVGLQNGWNKIPGGPGTSCASGSPYYFFVHPGNPRRLLIHFQKGGACWNQVNCDVRREPTFDPTVDDTDLPQPAGVFDFTNDDNPFKDFTVVFISYCTGDVHLGNRVAIYQVPATGSQQASTFQIHHQGYPNAMAALRWVFTNILSPDLIFVSGESAGAVASPFFSAVVANRYHKSRIVQLGDGAGGYRTPVVLKLLEGWGAVETIRRALPYWKHQDAINFETLYIVAAINLPSVRFSQFNTVEDSIQLLFLRLIGAESLFLESLLEQNYADIRKSYAGFRTFTAPGNMHTIMSRPEFYSLKVNGVRFRDWVFEMMEGKPVKNVKATTGN